MYAQNKTRSRWSGGGRLGLLVAAMAWLGCSSSPPSLPPDDPSGVDEPVAEPAPPEADMTCGLRIVSVPSAKILVDGKDVGMSPVEVEGLDAGSHDVTFVDETHGNVTLQVELAPGEFQAVHHNFPPKAKELGE